MKRYNKRASELADIPLGLEPVNMLLNDPALRSMSIDRSPTWVDPSNNNCDKVSVRIKVPELELHFAVVFPEEKPKVEEVKQIEEKKVDVCFEELSPSLLDMSRFQKSDDARVVLKRMSHVPHILVL